jgi:hypothetical protein
LTAAADSQESGDVTEPPEHPTWQQELRWLWLSVREGFRDWFRSPPSVIDFGPGCCSGVIAIILATVMVTWLLLGSLMALVVWPVAFVVGHGVRHATGRQHRYRRSLVADLRLTLVQGQHDER